MRIKSSHRADPAQALGATLRRPGARGWALVLYSLVLFGAGVAVHRAGFLGDIRDRLSPRGLTELFRQGRGWLSTPELLTLDIAHKDFMALARQRDLALARGVLMVSDEDFVPGSIRNDGRTIPVRLRLKGDLVDHLQGDKWSFRAVARRDSTLFGMLQFSLHHPQARAYVYEQVYHEMVRREGLIGLRYDFVDVVMNGKRLGIYALEEHFEKRVVEHNERTEGPIVRFSEDVRWAQMAAQTSTDPQLRAEIAGAGDYLAADIDAFQTTRWLTDSIGRGRYLAAVHTLEAFRRGQVSTSEAFDRKKLATFFALTDLLGAWHGAGHWTNARFYFNPITARLEPIAFDGFDRIVPTGNRLLVARARNLDTADDRYLARVFEDRAFYEDYVAELERVSDPAYLAAVADELAPVIERSLRVLYRDFPSTEFSWDPFLRRAEFIRTALQPPKAVQAYLAGKGSEDLELRLGNMQLFPIEVMGLVRDSVRFERPTPIELAGRPEAEPVRFETVRFPVPGTLTWPNDTLPAPLRVVYRVAGANPWNAADVLPWPPEGAEPTRAAIHRPPNATTFAFLDVDEARRSITIRPGTWTIDRDVLLPAGYVVYGGPGTTLDLRNGASIVSRSPLQFRGEPEDHVVIRSSDSTGGGVVVMQAGGPSRLAYVRFEGLANPAEGSWELTGAVSFYESPVDVVSSHFIGNRSEDGLHVMRTTFSLEQVTFRDTFSDALDIDFGKGTIRGATFVACGNDALDISGSEVDVDGVDVRGAGDKGLSAGENSHLVGRNVTLRDAAIGLASKDLSTIDLRDVTMTGGQVGLTAFRKKTEFGPASISVLRLQMRGQTVPYLIETGSSATVDGMEIVGNRSQVGDSLYGVVYGKASR